MECAALEVQGLARLAHTLLPSAEAPEVLRSLGGHISAQLHRDAARCGTTNGHVLWKRRHGKTAEQIMVRNRQWEEDLLDLCTTTQGAFWHDPIDIAIHHNTEFVSN